jgi:hypothetical protein
VHAEVGMAHMRALDDVGQRQRNPSKIVVIHRSLSVAVWPAACSPVGFRLYSSD